MIGESFLRNNCVVSTCVTVVNLNSKKFVINKFVSCTFREEFDQFIEQSGTKKPSGLTVMLFIDQLTYISFRDLNVVLQNASMEF